MPTRLVGRALTTPSTKLIPSVPRGAFRGKESLSFLYGNAAGKTVIQGLAVAKPDQLWQNG